MKPYRDYRDGLLKRLKNSEEAAAYINAAVKTGDPQDFLAAVRNVVEAQGNWARVARNAHLPRTHLYEIFGKKGNPEFQTLGRLLSAVGLQLGVTTKSIKKAA